MSSTELDSQQQQLLLELARESIGHGLEKGGMLLPDEVRYPQPLREQRATFVTLKIEANLRGCIGTLQPYRTLVADVAGHAHAAAFEDPRFPPLTHHEYGLLGISISVLSPADEVRFIDEDDLLRQLRPGIDGVILQEGLQRGTFLPSVWESLPSRPQFLQQLKCKAGLAEDYWSGSIRVWRYTTQCIN